MGCLPASLLMMHILLIVLSLGIHSAILMMHILSPIAGLLMLLVSIVAIKTDITFTIFTVVILLSLTTFLGLLSMFLNDGIPLPSPT